LVESAEIDLAGVKVAERRDRLIGEQAGADERDRVDEVRIARERGETLVGRVAEARRTERTHLPVGEAGVGQEIEEAVRRIVEGADAVGTRQRRRVQEHAGGPMVEPVEQGGRGRGRWHGSASCNAHAGGRWEGKTSRVRRRRRRRARGRRRKRAAARG